jgi:hypothetical protein
MNPSPPDQPSSSNREENPIAANRKLNARFGLLNSLYKNPDPATKEAQEILLATLSRQSIQLDQMQRAHEANDAWRNTFDDKLTEIMSLLKSMAHVVAHTSSNQVSSFPKSEAPVEVTERTEEQHPGPLERGNVLSSDLPELCKLHYFLSHYQASGGDQVGMLELELEKLGMLCWLGKP